MIQTAQFSRSNQQKRIVLRADVINRQQIVRQGNHQAAGAFEKNQVVVLQKLARRRCNLRGVNGLVVQLGREVRRARVREDIRARQVRGILVEGGQILQTAVHINVFGRIRAAGLNHFLGNYVHLFLGKSAGKKASRIRLADIRIDTGYEPNIFLHKILKLNIIYDLFFPKENRRERR